MAVWVGVLIFGLGAIFGILLLTAIVLFTIKGSGHE